MAAKKAKAEKVKAKTEKLEEKVEAKKEPEVEMVDVMRFNKIRNRREPMTVPKAEMLLGYYGDIVVKK
tara:strand:- start:1123 stop:1326 length:204 start_codon:yes stop_codon:yes gene_type:complete